MRVLIDKFQNSTNPCIKELLDAKITVKYTPPIMHNKFAIIDGKRIETGSFNYTHNASEKNYEIKCMFQHPISFEQFKQQFETMWTKGKELSDADINAIDRETGLPLVCK